MSVYMEQAEKVEEVWWGQSFCLFVVQFLSHLGCVKSVCLGDGHSKGNWGMLPLKVATPS